MTVWGGGVEPAEREGEGEGEESLTAMHTSRKGSKRGSVDSFPDQVQNQRRDPNIPETGYKGEQYRPVQTAEEVRKRRKGRRRAKLERLRVGWISAVEMAVWFPLGGPKDGGLRGWTRKETESGRQTSKMPAQDEWMRGGSSSSCRSRRWRKEAKEEDEVENDAAERLTAYSVRAIWYGYTTDCDDYCL